MYLALENQLMKRLKILLQSNAFYFFLFLLLCFYVFVFIELIPHKTNIKKDTKEITGKILSYSIDGDQVSLLLDVKEKVKATYYVSSKEEKEELEQNLKIGLTVTLYGEKKEIIGRTIPNTFDYKKYLEHEKIYFCFSASKLEIQKVSISLLNKIKNKIDERLKKLGNHPYLRAFVIGDKTLIDENQYDTIMKNGVGHLFALSGMHLSFVYLFLNKLMGKVKFKKILLFLFLFFYLFIAGFSVSFLRAILFLLLLEMNQKFHFDISRIKILFLTAFLLLFYNPFYLYSIGFWYTFVVTFSLLFTANYIRKHKKWQQVFLVSCITFLFSMPISIYVNYEINPCSILTNCLLVPFVSTIVFPLAIFTFLFPFLLPFFKLSISCLTVLNSTFLTFAFPLIVGKITLFEVLLLYFFLLIGFKWKIKKMFLLFLLFLTFLYNKNLFENHYYVYFLDVGQGDSTLFVSPKKKEVLLIDTGGNIPIPKKEYQIRTKEFQLSDSIVQFLKSIRVRKIDLLLITHGDLDHLGYAKEIGSEIPIKRVMINKNEQTDKEKELLSLYPQVEKYQSTFFDFQTYFMGIYETENDNSILTKIKIYNQTFLLMGDASSKVEEQFIKKYDIQATFLKVGHHGSKTSSSLSFLKQVKPNYAIISSGRNNRYHHPSKETLERLEALHIPYYNTQDSGTIEIAIDKKILSLN